MTTTTRNSSDLLLIHDPAFAGWVFDPAHPTQGRRFIKGRDRILAAAKDNGLSVEEMAPRPATRDELLRVHSSEHVSAVLDGHTSGEWDGSRPDLGDLAARFAGGTLVALEALLSERTLTAVNLTGAKHHAQRDRSIGFCVLADFALAATIASQDHGLRVAVVDLDAHHGDGTENLTRELDNVLTFSIHEGGIFPGTGNVDELAHHVHNRPLAHHAGDAELHTAMAGAIAVLRGFAPDLILLAAGADGHEYDPLSSLNYTLGGYYDAVESLRAAFPTLPLLMGGAGGYRPDDATPTMWTVAAMAAANPVERLIDVA